MAENSSLYWHALRNKMQNKHQTYPSYSTPQMPTPHGSVHYNYLESFHFVDGRFKDWKRLDLTTKIHILNTENEQKLDNNRNNANLDLQKKSML